MKSSRLVVLCLCLVGFSSLSLASQDCANSLTTVEQGFQEQLQKYLLRNMVVDHDEAQQLMSQFQIPNIETLMRRMIEAGKPLARPPISGYQVAAVGLEAETGDLVLGVNLEFPGTQLNQSVHGEQFVVARVATRGHRLEALAVSAAPCGHCRQFLNELVDGPKLKIFIAEQNMTRLTDLLPNAFGPNDLPSPEYLLAHSGWGLKVRKKLMSRFEAAAFDALNASYAPYTKSPAGVAIRLKNGRIYTGSYLENVAFNPSLPPLQVALVNMAAENGRWKDLRSVVLMETEDATSTTSHWSETIALARSVNPRVRLLKIMIKK